MAAQHAGSTGSAGERTPLLSTTSTTAASAASSVTDTETQPTGTSESALTRTPSKIDDETSGSPPRSRWSLWRPANRVLLASFIISLSFSFTQVSIFYVFRLMECDVYYKTHPPYTGPGDRCSRNAIAAVTARQFALLGASTSFFGTWNLFVAGQQVKRWGPRVALVLQTSVPAIRVLTQIIAIYLGGRAGVHMIHLTQAITIFGGPAGYILVVNTIGGEVVTPAERTSLFGRLQGCVMLGGAIGYLMGGIVGDTFGIVRPFQTAFFLFMLASVYARYAMPYISPESLTGPVGQKARRGGLSSFTEPLKVLLPQKTRLSTGRITKHYGVFFLCFGVFIGVIATGYAPILLQMYATARFDFNQANNAWLMSGNAFVRAFFLIFLFPRIIDFGRTWFARLSRDERRSSRKTRRSSLLSSTSSAPVSKKTKPRRSSQLSYGATDSSSGALANPEITEIPTRPEQFDAPMGTQIEEEPILVRVPTFERHHAEHDDNGVECDDDEDADEAAADEKKAAYAFDLFFLRWSLLVDGIITSCAALTTKGWHMYILTVLLPFGSGTAPAAKGVITSMCPSSQRTDALNAITLVENIARLFTLGVFGTLFSAMADLGQPHLTFYCNGALAIVGMVVLLFSHFPPRDSELVEEEEEEVAAVAADVPQESD
ncbi:hypothetical protein SEPCBS57363_002224 [Sporothrix epigloea]|uniref:Major facilitator superfamily transporter n=1 Tax=Sporothrix epigloea TaxID=1892477 RepID=A0ABP0DEN3_9PEZI